MKKENFFSKNSTILLVLLTVVCVIAILVIFTRKRGSGGVAASPRVSQRNKNILSFGGGGLKSITIDTAVLVGVIRKNTINKRKSSLADYLSQFRVIAGNSGGGWFLTLLNYSKKYFNMIDSASNLNVHPITGDVSAECIGGVPIPKSNKWLSCSGGHTNMQKCGKYCCCNFNTKYNNKQFLSGCDACKSSAGAFSFYSYMEASLQTIKNWPDNHNPSPALFRHLANMSPSWLKPILYFYYLPWYEVTNEVVFNPTGDIPNDLKISEPISNLNAHLVWGASVIRYANISKINNIQYYLTDPWGTQYGASQLKKNYLDDIAKNGIVFPVFLNYDNATGASMGLIPTSSINKGNATIAYANRPQIDILNTLTNINKNSLKNLKVRGVSACSGSAGGFACSKHGILQLLRTAEQTVTTPGVILNPTNDLISDQISKNFNDLAVPVKLKTKDNGIEIVCSPNAKTNACEEFEKTNPNVSEIENELAVRFIDGGYYDNTCVSFAIRAWQDKQFTSSDVCKIVYINNEDMSLVMKLFGCHIDHGTTNLNCNKDVINYFGGSAGNTKLWAKLANIFRKNDYVNGKCLWKSRCDPGTNPQSKCGAKDNICFAELSIHLHETYTIDNTVIGIKKGTKVQLYTINILQPIIPVFATPGELDDDTLSNFVTVAHRISSMIENLPIDLFDMVFNDSAFSRDIVNKYSCSTPITTC